MFLCACQYIVETNPSAAPVSVNPSSTSTTINPASPTILTNTETAAGPTVTPKPIPFEPMQLDLTKLKVLLQAQTELFAKPELVKINEATTLFLIPIGEDFALDPQREILSLSGVIDLTLPIAARHLLEDEEGNNLEFALLANSFGSPYFVMLLTSSTSASGMTITYTAPAEGALNSAVYIGMEPEIYPNKLFNILLAMSRMSAYQDYNGAFLPGQIYSQMEMLGLKNYYQRQDYLNGYFTSGAYGPAGGVCVTATALSTLFQELPEVQVLERVPHGAWYFQGPFSPPAGKVDAALFYRGDELTDFTWYLSGQDLQRYLSMEALLFPSGLPFEKTEIDGLGGSADVFGIFSFTMTKTEPSLQTDGLKELLSGYQGFRASQHAESSLFNPDLVLSSQPFDTSLQDLLNLIYNPSSTIEPGAD